MTGLHPPRRPAASTPEDVVWEPAAEDLTASALARFARRAGAAAGRELVGYWDLWQWSIGEPPGFWRAVAEEACVDVGGLDGPAVAGPVHAARWFPGVRLNYAAHALARRGPGEAAVFGSEDGTAAFTRDEIAADVARVAAGLRSAGVGPGDHVAAYAPATREALVAFLATASVGATWSVCSPDLGPASVLDRFRQISPVALVVVTAYRYGGRDFDRTAQVREVCAGLPSLRTVVRLDGSESELAPSRTVTEVPWATFGAGAEPVVPSPVPFEHPLWVVYSSGTSGPPKPIVHSHGGVLLEHHKLLSLQLDLGEGGRLSWFSTTGWIMWNITVGALLVGATPVFYDGNPGHPTLDTLWALAAEHRTTHVGASPAFFSACRDAGLSPGRDHDLSALRFLGSTGSPLAPEGFDWLADHVSSAALVGSMSGGTDIASAFVGPTRLLPVRRGRIQAPCLGVAAAAFSEAGRPMTGEVGELVVTEPMPSMPVRLVGDADGTRLRRSYFERFPGTWCHGDWIEIAADGSAVISGRSDATLNRGGVRIGTAEFYRVVEEHPAVVDSLVVDVAGTAEHGELVLFAVLGAVADPAAIDRELRDLVRRQLSPRYVPDRIVHVDALPRTLTGKKLEVPVKRILGGTPVAEAIDRHAVDRPEALASLVAAKASAAAR